MKPFRLLLVFFSFLVFPFWGYAQYQNTGVKPLPQNNRFKLGIGQNIYQAKNGLLWFGMNPAGLVYYDGLQLQQVPVDGESEFAIQLEVFIIGEDVFYLNLGNEVKVFDPILQTVTARIPLPDDLEVEIVHLVYNKDQDDHFLWAMLPPIPSPQDSAPYYHVYLSKNHQPFQLVSKSNVLVLGPPAMVPIGPQLFLKTEGGFQSINEQGDLLNKFLTAPPNFWRIEQETLSSDGKNKVAFATWDHGTGNALLYVYKSVGDSLVLDFEQLSSRRTGLGFTRIDIRAGRIHWSDVFVDVIDLESYEVTNYRGWDGIANYTSYLDGFGNTWIGDVRGISKCRTYKDVFQKYEGTKNRKITEDDAGNIYVGKDGQHPAEIQKIHVQQDSVSTHIFPEALSSTFSINYEKDKLFFGFSRLPANSMEDVTPLDWLKDNYNIYSKPFIQILDADDRLWSIVWYSDQLVIINPDTKAIQRITIPELKAANTEYNILYQRPSDESIWLGTQGAGIFVFDKNGNRLGHYTSDQDSDVKLKNNIINSFYEDEQNRLWFGHGEGLSYLDTANETIKHFIINSEEPDYNFVYGILPEMVNDQTKYLWLSTNRGIYRFGIETGQSMGLHLHEDVMNTEFNRTSFYKAKNGRCYFGSYNNGVFAFYPDEVMQYYESERGENLPILINHFSKFDTKTAAVVSPVKVTQNIKEIVLTPRDRFFDLKFTIADFRRPEKNIYTHKLEGYDDNWKTPSTTANTIHYENLPAGTYTLKMRGGLFPSALPNNEKHVKVIVLPFWYQTWWAFCLFGLALLGLAYALYTYNLKRQLAIVKSRQLQELNALKSRFYTNITHEFRTPITVILGMNRERDNPKAQDLIERNGKKLLQLINQLLNLSKIDTGNLNTHYQQIEIVSFTQYIGESFQSLADQKYIRLTIYSEIKQLYMDMDEEKYSQIISNLLSNAIKFTPESGKIILHLSQQEQQLVLKVIDNGIGISPETLPHIFDRFYQVEHVASRQGKGTGIGLALVKELVQLLEGTIAVESAARAGTTFSLRFPIRQTAPQKQTAYEQITVDRSIVDEVEVLTPEQNTELPLLLVIEDNADVVIYIQSLLSQQYTLLIAANGEEGIEKATEYLPDIILCDVMMPKKDGFEVVASLKQDERTCHIPIVLLTARATREDRIAGLQHGADAYLMKPFDKAELFVRLEQLVALRRALQARYARAAQPTLSPASFRENGSSAAPSLDELFLQKIRQIIDEKIDDADLDIAYICKTVGLSATQLHRKMKALTGEPPMSFIRQVRLYKAKDLLQHTDLTVAEIAYQVGFSDPDYFSRAFGKMFGEPPTDVRK